MGYADRIKTYEHPGDRVIDPVAGDETYVAIAKVMNVIANDTPESQLIALIKPFPDVDRLITAALAVADGAFSRGCCGETECPSGLLEDLISAVEAVRA